MQITTQTFAVLAAFFAAMAESKPVDTAGVLTPRDTVDDHRDDLEAYSCGLYATANGIDISINSNNLFDEVDKSVTLPANSCGRIACYDTTGVHVCNDQDVEISVPHRDVGQAAYWLGQACFARAGFLGIGTVPTSGRVYSSREGGYNVNIGFCDNSVDTHVSPASYTYLGPNAEAGKHCGPEFGFEACQKPS